PFLAERPGPVQGGNRGSRTLEDGEMIVGLTIRYPPSRPFFFLLPVDPESNNLRMLINRNAVASMEALGAE
ncbi:MAG TPA: hypothetical protein VJ725_06535, partial [Thermoanaerobaculia bacterium]|nr:hypothetical protein [Thermoanaerobaculia bacterium]